ncbi:MAG: branched-chain amino acid ABC transporter permease [Nanoarchaeota archaeon]
MALINYFIHLAVLIGIYAIFTVGLNIAVGFTGLLNLGHVGFFGIGAYTSALLALAGVPLWIAIPAAAIVAGISGLVLALPTARLKGDYLALAALGFTFIVGSVARNWTDLTRGPLGLPGIPRVVASTPLFLVIVVVLTVIIALAVHYLMKTRFGRTLQAIRDDELAAATLGYNTFLHKVIAMGISACIAGIAGALFAHYISFIDPSVFGIGDLILVLSMLIVGGLASIPGSIAGATIILLIPEPLRFIGFPSSLIGPMREILFALILLIIIIYRPKGILGKVDLQ